MKQTDKLPLLSCYMLIWSHIWGGCCQRVLLGLSERDGDDSVMKKNSSTRVTHGSHIRGYKKGSKWKQNATGSNVSQQQVANTGSVLEIAYKNTKKTRWEKSHCCLREVLKWLLIRVAVNQNFAPYCYLQIIFQTAKLSSCLQRKAESKNVVKKKDSKCRLESKHCLTYFSCIFFLPPLTPYPCPCHNLVSFCLPWTRYYNGCGFHWNYLNGS